MDRLSGGRAAPRLTVGAQPRPVGRPIRGAIARERSEAVRLSIVVICVLLTAGIYAACVAVIVLGDIQTLYASLPWLAALAIGGCLLLALAAMSEHWRQHLRQRRVQRVARTLLALADPSSLISAESRSRATRGLMKRLDLLRDALALPDLADSGVRSALTAAGLADAIALGLAPTNSTWHRVTAAGILATLGAPESIDPLTRMVEDQGPDVGYAAAQALSTYSQPAAYEALLGALTLETVPPARVAALLETFRCPDARPMIEQRADAAEAEIRYWAAYLLGRLGDPRSAPVVERLTRDVSEDVRANAAEALVSFPDEATLRRLLADESWVVRSHAAKTAREAGLPSLAPLLAGLLTDRSWWVRQNAALALSELGEPAMPVLEAQLRSDDRFARNKSAEVLVGLGYAARQLHCLQETGGEDQDARQRLIDLGRAEALSSIVIAARSTIDPEFRSSLIDVLREIDIEQARVAVRELTEHDPPDTAPRRVHVHHG